VARRPTPDLTISLGPTLPSAHIGLFPRTPNTWIHSFAQLHVVAVAVRPSTTPD
jgi:hypothetical protein